MKSVQQEITFSEMIDTGMLERRVSLLVLVRNKSMIMVDNGWEYHIDCLTLGLDAKPVAVRLYFYADVSDLEGQRVNADLQIGEFYLVTGEDAEVDARAGLLLRGPDYQEVDSEQLPYRLARILIDGVSADDLCFEYITADDCLKKSYKKGVLFSPLLEAC